MFLKLANHIFLLVFYMACKNSTPAKKSMLVFNEGVDTSCIENANNIRLFAKPESDIIFWQHFELNSTINKNNIFKKLDNFEDPHDRFDRQKSNRKRTANIHHYKTECDYFKIVKDLGNIAVCHAYLNGAGDSLQIIIGFNSGLGGQGFKIFVTRNKFLTMPWYSDDVVYPDEVDPLNYPAMQKLILNNSSFSLNDSVFGYVAFKSVFFDEYGHPSKHDVSGYFRAKIEKKYW